MSHEICIWRHKPISQTLSFRQSGSDSAIPQFPRLDDHSRVRNHETKARSWPVEMFRCEWEKKFNFGFANDSHMARNLLVACGQFRLQFKIPTAVSRDPYGQQERCSRAADGLSVARLTRSLLDHQKIFGFNSRETQTPNYSTSCLKDHLSRIEDSLFCKLPFHFVRISDSPVWLPKIPVSHG